MRKIMSVFLCIALCFSMLTGCSSNSKEKSTVIKSESSTEEGTTESVEASTESEDEITDTTSEEVKEATNETIAEADAEEVQQIEATEIQVFIAASLNTAMQEVAAAYNETQPNVKITYNADSSGKLLTQIEEGYECDIFFCAAQKQMDQLVADKLVIDGTRKNVVNNQVVVISLKDSKTAVTGLETLGKASSIALAGGSVPVGKYTRQALVNLGILNKVEDVSTITTREVSDALGGVEISEQDNVSKVLIAVTEGSCEVGTTYYSDTYGYEDKVDLLERVSYDISGDVIYPVCQVSNQEADATQEIAAEDFYNFILSDTAKAIFTSYYFDTDVQ